MEKSYKEIMPQITTFIFDVDGVLTDGTVTIFPNGDLIRSMNTKDGYALKTAVDMGFNVCIITGGTHTSIKSRLNRLGINDIYLGAHNKIDKMVEYLEINEISAENVLYMGDDIPDIPPMQISVLPTCPKDAVHSAFDWMIFTPFMRYNIRNAKKKQIPYSFVEHSGGKTHVI